MRARAVEAVTVSSRYRRATERTELTTKSCSAIGFFCHQKHTGNRRPPAKFGVDPDIAAVEFDDALTQR